MIDGNVIETSTKMIRLLDNKVIDSSTWEDVPVSIETYDEIVNKEE